MQDTILVLDDSASNREIIAKLLRNFGFNVLTAENGEEGFKSIEKCQKENLNLVAVISDMMMPVVDGPAFVFRLREDARYENLPVLFMTSATDKKFLLEAKKLKAAGFILKPINIQQVTTQLDQLFPHKLIKKAGA